MASNCTENFGLNQWAAEDKVLREEFNADNQKIDAALAGGVKIAAGSYTGNGKCGASNPNKITFPFRPSLLIIAVSKHAAYDGPSSNAATGSVVMDCTPLTEEYTTITINSNTRLNFRFVDGVLSWYATDNYPSYQFNHNNAVYNYLAIGQ